MLLTKLKKNHHITIKKLKQEKLIQQNNNMVF